MLKGDRNKTIMPRKYDKKSKSEIMADNVHEAQKILFREIKNLQKLRKSKGTMDVSDYKQEYEELKETIELLTKLTGPVGYMAQTYTGMMKTLLSEKRLIKVEIRGDLLEKLLPRDIHDKYLEEVQKRVPLYTKEELNNFR